MACLIFLLITSCYWDFGCSLVLATMRGNYRKSALPRIYRCFIGKRPKKKANKLNMKLRLKKLLLIISNALIPGFGPLFYGISNISIFGIISGIAILSTFAFVILIALNGEFFSYETYNNISLALFHGFNGHKLEKTLWTILFIILISTLTLYSYIVYLSYKITLNLNKTIQIDAKKNSVNNTESKCTKSCQTDN